MKPHLNDPIFSQFLPDPALVLGVPSNLQALAAGKKGRCHEVFHIEEGFITDYPRTTQRLRVKARIYMPLSFNQIRDYPKVLDGFVCFVLFAFYMSKVIVSYTYFQVFLE